jgi:hypothetical protein
MWVGSQKTASQNGKNEQAFHQAKTTWLVVLPAEVVLLHLANNSCICTFTGTVYEFFA